MSAFRYLAVFMWAVSLVAAVVVVGHFAGAVSLHPPFVVAGVFEVAYGLAFGAMLWRIDL